VHDDQRGGFVSWQGQWGSLMVLQNILVKTGDDACEDQAIACKGGSDRCNLVRLILLLGWKILFGIRQDHQKLKYEDLPYST
jgi:hypothetical protein